MTVTGVGAPSDDRGAITRGEFHIIPSSGDETGSAYGCFDRGGDAPQSSLLHPHHGSSTSSEY